MNVNRTIGRPLIFAALLISILTTCVSGQNAPPPTADGWVVLPVNEYSALKEAAFPGDAEPAPPPVEATLSRIDYELKVDGELATGEARLTVDVIKNGWVRLAIPAGLMVREANLDGRVVNLVVKTAAKGPSSGELLLSKPGRSVLILKIVAPVTTVAGTDLLQLPVSNSAISRASIEVLRQGVDVRITGGLLLEHSDTAQGTKWIANGRGNEPLTFAWRRRIDDQRTSQALRFRGSVAQLVGLGEDATQISAEVQVEVLQGLASEVRLVLPDQFIVNQVSGAMVTDWDAKPRELTVTFIEPIAQTTRFTLSGELRLPRSGQLEVPLIRMPSAERESGGVAVEVLGAGEIKDRKFNGLDEAEAGELGQLIASRQSPSIVAFRYSPSEGKAARSLQVNVARYTPQAVLTANIEQATYNALVTTDGKLLIQSRFSVRNNQRNFLKLTLPSTATLWSASVAGRPIRPGRAPDGSLLLPLEKMRTGDDAAAFVVEISYLDRTAQWADRGRLQLSLVSVDLPISKSHVLLHHSPLFRVTAPPGVASNFRVAPYEASTATDFTTPASSSPTLATLPELDGSITSKLVSKLPARGGTPTRNLPLRVTFPHFGPSVFLIAELTSENQRPVVELDFLREKKRGDK